MVEKEVCVFEDLNVLITNTLMSLHTRNTQNISLGFGKGGDLLFLFYSIYSVNKVKISPRVLKKMTDDIFKEIMIANSDIAMSYWEGIVGLVQLLEVLDQSELADIDLNKVLMEFDAKLLNYLIYLDNSCNESLLMLNTLLSRIRHYEETDVIHLNTQFLCVKNVENVIRFFDSKNIDLYKEDISVKIDFLRKVFRMGLYKPALTKIAEKLESLVGDQFARSPVTLDFVNNILSIREYLISTNRKNKSITNLSTKLCSINYLDIQIDSRHYFCFTPEYLTTINKLIYFNRCFAIPNLDTFIKFRLKLDINCAFTNCLSEDIKGGIIGLSGIAITSASYYDSNMPKWNNVLMIF